MSCWVVPSVAAEYWGIPVEQVLTGIRSGSVPTKRELGFTLVDVAPSPAPAAPNSIPKALRPPTFTAAPAVADLTGGMPVLHAPNDDDDEPLNYRPARSRVSATRRPPRALRMAA